MHTILSFSAPLSAAGWKKPAAGTPPATRSGLPAAIRAMVQRLLPPTISISRGVTAGSGVAALARRSFPVRRPMPFSGLPPVRPQTSKVVLWAPA